MAAEILMPPSDVLSSQVVAGHRPGNSWTLAELLEGAKPYGVSVEAFLRGLVTLGSTTLAKYRHFRELQGDGGVVTRGSSGGNFYYTKARDLGKATYGE